MKKLLLFVVALSLLPLSATAQKTPLHMQDIGITNAIRYGDGSCSQATLDAAQTALGAVNKGIILLSPVDRTGATCTWALSGSEVIDEDHALYIPHGAKVTTSGSIEVRGHLIMDSPQSLLGEYFATNLTIQRPTYQNFLSFSSTHENFVVSGCLATNPGGLDISITPCTAWVNGRYLNNTYTTDSETFTTNLSGGNGTYYLVLAMDGSTSITSYTQDASNEVVRWVLTSYVDRTPWAMLIAEVVVSGGAVTTIRDRRTFATVKRARHRQAIRIPADGADEETWTRYIESPGVAYILVDGKYIPDVLITENASNYATLDWRGSDCTNSIGTHALNSGTTAAGADVTPTTLTHQPGNAGESICIRKTITGTGLALPGGAIIVEWEERSTIP